MSTSNDTNIIAPKIPIDPGMPHTNPDVIKEQTIDVRPFKVDPQTKEDQVVDGIKQERTVHLRIGLKIVLDSLSQPDSEKLYISGRMYVGENPDNNKDTPHSIYEDVYTKAGYSFMYTSGAIYELDNNNNRQVFTSTHDYESILKDIKEVAKTQAYELYPLPQDRTDKNEPPRDGKTNVDGESSAEKEGATVTGDTWSEIIKSATRNMVDGYGMGVGTLIADRGRTRESDAYKDGPDTDDVNNPDDVKNPGKTRNRPIFSSHKEILFWLMVSVGSVAVLWNTGFAQVLWNVSLKKIYDKQDERYRRYQDNDANVTPDESDFESERGVRFSEEPDEQIEVPQSYNARRDQLSEMSARELRNELQKRRSEDRLLN